MGAEISAGGADRVKEMYLWLGTLFVDQDIRDKDWILESKRGGQHSMAQELISRKQSSKNEDQNSNIESRVEWTANRV